MDKFRKNWKMHSKENTFVGKKKIIEQMSLFLLSRIALYLHSVNFHYDINTTPLPKSISEAENPILHFVIRKFDYDILRSDL